MGARRRYRDSAVERVEHRFLPSVHPLGVALIAVAALVGGLLQPVPALAAPPAPPAAVNPAPAVQPITTPGPTFVTSSVTADTTWGPSGSPYVITSTIQVSSGASLTLLPGTIVKIGGEFTAINITTGQLLSLGNPEAPVVITSLKDDSVGGDTNGDGGATTPAPGDWYNISVYGASSTDKTTKNRAWTVFDYTHVRYGGNGSGVYCTNYAAISISSTMAYVTVSNSEISDAEYADISVRVPKSGHVGIYNNTFKRSRCGVQAWSTESSEGTFDIVGNTFDSSLWENSVFALNPEHIRMWFNTISSPITAVNSVLPAPTNIQFDVRYNTIGAGIDIWGSKSANKADYPNNWWGSNLNTATLPACMSTADAQDYVPPITYTTSGCPSGQVHPTGYQQTVTPSLSGLPAELPLSFARSQAPTYGPVDTFRGVLNYSAEDLVVNDAGQAIVASRVYRSDSRTIGDAGLGWSVSYTESLSSNADVTKMRLHDGSVIPFAQDPAAGYTPAPGVIATLDLATAGSSVVTPNGTTYQFDPLGELDRMMLSDPGHEIDVAYVNGELDRVTGVSGRFLDYQHGGGLLSAVSDDADRSVAFSYDSDDRLISVTGVDGAMTRYEYTDDRLTKVKSALGVALLEVGYHSDGRVAWVDPHDSGRADITYGETDRVIKLADGTEIRQLFDWAGRLVTEQLGADGPSKHVVYDGEGRVLSVVEGIAPGPMSGYSAQAQAVLYDRNGDPVLSIDPIGRVTRTSFSSTHKPLAVNYADGTSVTHGYDASDRAATVVDQTGQSWGLQYNAVGQNTTITDPLGRSEVFAFEPDGDTASHTDQLGGVTNFVNDAFGRPISETDPLGRTTAYAYTPWGAVETTTSPGGGQYRVTFDDDRRVLRLKDPAGHSTEYTYDDGRLKSLLDPLGQRMIFGYDAVGRPTSVTTPGGETYTQMYTAQGWPVRVSGPGATGDTTEFGPSGRQVRITDALGQVTQTVYNRAGEVVKKQTPDGGSESWQYDLVGRPSTHTSPIGGVSTTQYDPFGNVLKTTDSLGAVESHSYDAVSRIVSTTAPNGNVRAYSYDDANRTMTMSDLIGVLGSIQWDAAGQVSERVTGSERIQYEYNPDGLLTVETSGASSIQYGYDSVGNVISRTDPNGNAVSAVFDALGRVTSVEYPGSLVETNTYDALGNVSQTTDVAGNDWTYTYDARRNLTSATDPAGNVSSYTFDALDRMTSSTDRTDVAWTYAYDPVGRPAVVTDDDGNSTVTTYDHSGNVLTSADPAGVKHTSVYDKRNQLKTVSITGLSYPTSFTYDTLGNLLSRTTSSQTQTWSYDLRGRNVTTTDPVGRVTTFAFDLADNVISETTNDGRTTQWSYDPMGRLTGAVDPAGNATSYSHDAAGNVTAIELPAGGVYGFGYDASHRLASETDPLGRTTEFDYDAIGNLITTTTPDGNTVTSTWNFLGKELTRSASGETRSFGYDEEGRVLRASANNADMTFGYDTRGLLSSYSDALGVTDFTYDASRRLAQIALPTGDVTNITYNGFGSVATVRGPTNLNYNYDRWGNPTKRSAVSPTASSATHLLGYFTDNAPESVTVGSTAMKATYDADGQVSTTTNTISGATNPAEGTTEYEYDAVGRLVDWAVTSDGAPVASERYTWDANSNRTSVTRGDVTTTSVYDAADQLVSLSDGTTYEYGLKGELLDINSPTGQDTSYRYNAFGELIAAEVDGHAIDLKPDALGRVAELAVDGQTATYGYQGPTNETSGIKDESGTVTAIIRDSAGTALATHAGSATHSVIANLHGDTSLYLGTSSTPVATAIYSPFGTPTVTGSAPTSLGFQSMMQHPALGLIDMGARHYDAESGRFINRDSVIGDLNSPRTLNRYIYGVGAPLDHFDPDGHFAEELGDFVSLVGKTVTAAVTTAKTAVENVGTAVHDYLVDGVSGYNSDNWTSYRAASAVFGETGVGLLFGLDMITNFQSTNAIAPSARETLQVSNAFKRIGGAIADSGAMRGVHATLDVLGFVPVVGEAFDAANGALYLLEGDVGNALLSFAAIVPVVGSGVVAVGRAGLRLSDETTATLHLFAFANRLPSARPADVGAIVGDAANNVPSVTFSRSRAPGIAQTFDDAVAGGAPTRLTRVDAATRDANRRAALRGQSPAPAGQSLDEYPFACTAQGGCGAIVRSVPIGEQSYQGGVLSRFFQDYGVRPDDPFDVMFGP